MTEPLPADQKLCPHCGMGRDGSIELTITIMGECDCAAKAPTMPVFRNATDHLPECQLRKAGYGMIRKMSFDLGMRAEVTES